MSSSFDRDDSATRGLSASNPSFAEADWIQLPGAEWVRMGLADIASEQKTIAAMAVLVVKPRLVGLGFRFNHNTLEMADPEGALYDMLCLQHGDEANAAFNAIRQELVSFADGFDQIIGARQLLG